LVISCIMSVPDHIRRLFPTQYEDKEDLDFRGVDHRGMPRGMLHSMEECNLWNSQLLGMRAKAMSKTDSFARHLMTLYSTKEIANMSADFMYRTLMRDMLEHVNHKEEVADFLVQDSYPVSDDKYNDWYKKAECAAKKELDNGVQEPTGQAMKAVFSVARNEFFKVADQALPDTIIDRFASHVADSICIDILKHCNY
jgi:hypothetical protein